jgi:hypothetical protein
MASATVSELCDLASRILIKLVSLDGNGREYGLPLSHANASAKIHGHSAPPTRLYVLRTARASTDPATSSKVESSVFSEAYFDARISSRGWRETAGTNEVPGVARKVSLSSFFFLLFLAERPLRYESLVKKNYLQANTGNVDAPSAYRDKWHHRHYRSSSSSSDMLTDDELAYQLAPALPKSSSQQRMRVFSKSRAGKAYRYLSSSIRVGCPADARCCRTLTRYYGILTYGLSAAFWGY